MKKIKIERGDLAREFENIFRLSSIRRYSRDHSAKTESVLEHIGFCSVFAIFVCEYLKEVKEVTVKRGRVLARLAVHDFDEIIFGDVPHTTKYYNPAMADAYHAAEKEAMMNNFSPETFRLWSSAKADDIEGAIVTLTDMASVIYKCRVEFVSLRNEAFRRVCYEAHDNLLATSRMLMENYSAVLGDFLETMIFYHNQTLSL